MNRKDLRVAIKTQHKGYKGAKLNAPWPKSRPKFTIGDLFRRIFG